MTVREAQLQSEVFYRQSEVRRLEGELADLKWQKDAFVARLDLMDDQLRYHREKAIRMHRRAQAMESLVEHYQRRIWTLEWRVLWNIELRAHDQVDLGMKWRLIQVWRSWQKQWWWHTPTGWLR